MIPRVLLLQEDQATGGVTTIVKTLCKALQSQGWSITTLLLDQSGWRERIGRAWHCDVILASHNFGPAYVAWALGLLFRKPVVVWVHGPLREVLALSKTSALKRIWLRWLYRRISQFVFVSQHSRDSFESFMGLQCTRIPHASVIRNIAPLSLASVSKERPATADDCDVRLAFVGRLSDEKRPQILLDVLRLLPDRFKLTLVGDGPLRHAILKDGADLLSANRLSLMGEQAHDHGLYSAWDLTLLTSLYEGYPMCPLESLAAGVPCVGLPIAPLQEMMGTEASYFLARDHSAQALADAVRTVLALPHHRLREDMKRVLSRHREQDFVQRWQAVLQDAAGPC